MTTDELLWNSHFETEEEPDNYYKEEYEKEIYYERKYNKENE